MPLVYKYDEITGEYLGSKEAKPNPVNHPEPYRLPANATFVAPPDKSDNESIVWIGSSWNIVEDKRKKDYYDPDTGKKVKIDKPNQITSVLVETKPPKNIKKPKYDGSKWVEDGLVYKDTLVETAEDVWSVNHGILVRDYDQFNAMVAGIDDPTSKAWKDYKKEYDRLVVDANNFIASNGL